jgi:hypothetical protein
MSGNDLPSTMEPSSRRWETWLGVPVGFVVVGVAAWLLTVYAHAPIVAAWLVIAAVGWMLSRFGKASVLGIIVWIAAAAVLSAGFWTPVSFHGLFFFPSSFAFTAGGLLLSLPAGIIFLIASIKNQPRCAGNCAGCMIVLFTFVIYCTSGSTMQTHRFGPESIQETRQMILTMHRLSAEIEAIRAKTGRLPKDEAELVALRGKPMPPYRGDYRVSYQRNDQGGYNLNCCASHFWGRGWDIFGWILIFHGPDAVQRLQAILF